MATTRWRDARSRTDSPGSCTWAARSGSTRTRRSSIRWRCRPISSTPTPHSARFDFAATAAGSEWIDALSPRARRVLDVARLDPPVLVHGDWRIENVNVAAGAVVAIYDWDSVCTEPEIFAVANAMVTHSVDWSRPVGEHFPANAAIRSFLTDYEAARGETFAADQHRVIAARMAYHLAYGARCEHAISFPEVDDSQQGLLRRLGQPLLTDGLAALDD